MTLLRLKKELRLKINRTKKHKNKNKLNTRNKFKKLKIKTSENMKYKCSFAACKFKTMNLKDFNRHLIIHTTLKPFACNFCKYKCNRNDNLKLHIRNIHFK